MSNDRWYLNPAILAKIHIARTGFWILFLVPLFLWWSQSIPLLQFISVWALVESALSGWQASIAQLETRKANRDE